MEELDLLKKDWNKSQANFPQVSEKEIYAMLHKRSSSSVKWILIISILELALWLGLTVALNFTSGAKTIESYNVSYITTPLTILGHAIIIYFCIQFYIRYKKIVTTDNVKTLMANILNARKTVSNYIFINIAFMIINSIISFVLIYKYDANLHSLHDKLEANGKEVMFFLLYIGFTILCIGVFFLIIWLFYKLIYGLLLKRLHRNYEELKKIDF